MGKRKIKNADFNHFGDDGGRNREDASYEETNAAFFGQFTDLQAVKQLRIEQVDIFDIVPDFGQARRAIPSMLRYGKKPTPDQMASLFEQWLQIANDERKKHNYQSLNLRDAIEMVETALLSPIADQTEKYENDHRLPRMWITDRGARIDPRDWGDSGMMDDGLRPEWIEGPDSIELKRQLAEFSAEAGLMNIIVLAASIRQDGLTNPITIARFNPFYVIETGERRWMSYHLLYSIYGKDWRHIPARISTEHNVWRQASENNARQELNAISKARQLAILIMDTYRRTGVEFLPITEVEHEKDYYAQVADGIKWRVLPGDTQKLLTFLGFTNPSQIRQYRALLRIDYELWDFADDNNITEFELREMQRQGIIPSKNKPAKKLEHPPEPELSLFNKHWTQLAERQRALAKKMTRDDRHKMVIMMRALADEIEKMK